MRRTVFSSLILVLAAAAQPELRQVYEKALREWRQADAGLDVSKASPGELLERLKDVQSKRSAAAAAASRYYEAVRRRHETPLPNIVPARMDTREAAALGRDTAAELAADLNTVMQELKTTSPTAVLRLGALRQQRDGLTELRNLYTQRQKALEQIGALNESLDNHRTALSEAYAQSVSAINAHQGVLEASGKAWEERYENLRRTALEQALAAAAPQPKPVEAPPPAATVQPPPVVVRNLTGKWILAAPRAEKFSDAAGPLYGDVSVVLEIAETGGQLSGVYNGVVFVPPNESYHRNVNFRFTAPAGPGPVLEGRIDSPLSGTVKIEWVEENHIRISYKIDRTAASASISFKEGGVKELRRP